MPSSWLRASSLKRAAPIFYRCQETNSLPHGVHRSSHTPRDLVRNCYIFLGRYEDSQDESPQEIELGKKIEGIATTTVATAAKTPQQSLRLQEQQERQWAAGEIDGVWTYEHVAAVPEVAAEFEEFARRALCQESVLFLQEVSR